MKQQIITRFLIIFAIAVISIVLALPSGSFGDSFLGKKLENFKITLGLDLAGGTELDYKIDLSEAMAQNSDNDSENDVNINAIAESVRDALEKRVNPAGVGEIIVKRSQINDEEHIIIQMPPSSNVAQAKQDAEQDNRLEFFEENPDKAKKARTTITTYLEDITPQNWNQKIEELTQLDNVFHNTVSKARFKSEIIDQDLAEKIFATTPNSIIREIIETQTEIETTIDENGQIQLTSFPKDILAIVKVNESLEEDREKTTPPKAKVRHILFAYPEATRAPEDVHYQNQEEAKAKAEETLEKLKNEGTGNFADLAKQLSTEPAAQESGGDLGEFEPGKMVAQFDEAVFSREKSGLLEEVIETPFGFHVIEVLSITPEVKETVREEKRSYEMIAWDINEIIWTPTPLGGAQLENAIVGYNEIGQPLVNLLFDSEGGDMFAELTGNVASRKCNDNPCRLGIKVGGNWITQPTVQEKIIGRNAQITGQFTFESAKRLADGLNLGAIDAPVNLSGQTTITPQLGEAQLQKSLKAGFYGFLATIIFMIIMYRFAGFIAGIALLLYATLFITILKTWPESLGGPIVLSLSGVAGIVLSIGLAVDGNILIFERLKEELFKGKSLRQAVDLGFERAWSAIRDSNLTTLLTCIILFSTGSSIIKGFAITLIVGTILSMFTALTLSRNLLRFTLLSNSVSKTNWFGVSQKKLNNTKSNIRKRH